MTAGSLAVLERAEQMLAEVATAQEAANLVDMAEAARLFAKQARLGTASVNHATAIKLKAEIRLAECVEAGQAAGEIATSATGGGRPTTVTPSSGEGVTCGPATFADLGVTYRQVHESRKIRQHYTPEAIDATIADATANDVTVARKDFIKGTAHVSTNSGKYEFYTPAPIIEAARTVLGCIDLDPATSDTANETVQAARGYTQEDDGLTQPWTGRVWLNPPFARGLVDAFTRRLLEEYTTGNVTAAIALTHNGTETAWGQALLQASAAVCFPKGRINFNDATGQPRTESGALQGQMIAYLGPDPQRFRTTFTAFGAVL